jgi:hypothetical protein
MASFAGLRRIVLVSAAIIAGGGCFLASKPVEAQCAVQPEDGSWVNVNPTTRSITRIQLRFTCQDQVVNGQPNPPGPAWHVHVFGKCHPSDCDWGEIGAQRLNNGQIFAVYNQGFAKRFVTAQMSPQQPSRLQVIVRTDFTDPNRRDYNTNDLFNKQ